MPHQQSAIKQFQQRTIRMLQRPSSAAISWLKKLWPTKKKATVANRCESDLSDKPTSFCTFTLKPFEQTWVIEKISAYLDEDMVRLPSMSSYYMKPNPVKDFRLYINLRTRSTRNPEFVSLFLLNEFNDQSDVQKVLFKLSIIDRDGVKRHSKASVRTYGPSQTPREWPIEFVNFIAKSTLLDPANGLTPDDKLTIYCEAYLIDVESANSNDQSFATSIDSGEAKLDSKFVEWKTALFESGNFTDVVLAFDDGRELRAHKAILASASAVFEVMFNCDWLENSPNRVTITDTSVELFQQMLQYIYTEKLELIDQCDQQLMILADKYQIGSLKNLCEESLCSKLSFDNATELLELFNTFDADKLKAALMDLVKRQFDDSAKAILNNPQQAIEAGKFLFALTGGERKSI